MGKHIFSILSGLQQKTAGVVFIYLIPFHSIVTTDKVFILLLVILLPLIECLDMTDNAEAEESDDENTITTMPMVHSLHIEANLASL